MGWQITPRTVFLFLGLPILGVCAATLYYIHRKEENDWDDLGAIYTNRSNVIEVKVPSEHVGTVIGRAGANIKEIQEKTNTKINFKDANPDAEYRICRIRGTAEGTQLAESLIHETIVNQPVIETVEMWVPQKACGRIIGRCGDNIRAISKQSNAQINVDRMASSKGNDMKQVIIKGTAEQIAVAKSLIEEKIEEDDIARGEMQQTLANRSPRNKPNKNKKKEEERRYERLIATNCDNNMIQVYVSSVATPSNFWLQLINPAAAHLDHLVDEMTEYYNKEENRELHKLKEVEQGQILASRFSVDNKWYRVEVCKVDKNDENPLESIIDVYHVDYGDSEFQKISNLCELRTDFLQLRFQAIECSMAGIKPKGDDWTEESITAFEDMCYSARWKALTAQIVGYKERERSHREGSPVPCICLYDPAGEKVVDLAKELIEQGFADPVPEVTPNLFSNENTLDTQGSSDVKNSQQNTSFIQKEGEFK